VKLEPLPPNHDRTLYLLDGGYYVIKIGLLTFWVGKDASETDRRTYGLHYSSVHMAEVIGLEGKNWRTLNNFKRDAREALIKWCKSNLEELS
jgi:hypothetical protein